MGDIEVRIVELKPLQVACALGYGEQPEFQSWDKILGWAKAKGLLADLEAHRFFGFNNPNPSPGNPNYGYEQWITVGPDVKAEGDIKVKDFEGGLYAVTRCKLSNIGEAWQQLVIWQEDSPYQKVHRQCLEECLNPEVFITSEGKAASDESAYETVIFDLYLPVAE